MRRFSLWFAGAVLAFVLLFAISGLIVDGPLRGYMERKLNSKLVGYTVRLEKTDFHPFGFGLDLLGLTLVQDALPDPPVLNIPELRASVQWRKIVRGKLVADFALERPVCYLDRRHAEAEDQDDVPVQKRGWQDAVQAIYPLKINELHVSNAQFTYLDAEHSRPLELRDIVLEARDIRNRRSEQRFYPSPIRARARVFDRGSLDLEGHADLLAKPHAGVHANLTLADVALDYFAPILERAHLAVRGGWLGATGLIEYAPHVRLLDLEELKLRDLDADWIHASTAQVRAEVPTERITAKARELANTPAMQLHADRLVLENATVGWVNHTTDPHYRIFLSDTNLEVLNFSNQFARGPADVHLTGKFMDAGSVVGKAQFRPEKDGPDLDLDLRIENVPLVRLNEVLRAHGHFDVVAGEFSLYTQIGVQNGNIRGYVKPLFRNIDVYDSKQDKGFWSKIYEGLVGGLATFLKNDERDEVATRTEITGRLDDPKTSTWQVVGNLLKNALFQAILPGFEREVRRS